MLPAPSVCRCFPAASEAAIMTLLLMALARFPLKIVKLQALGLRPRPCVHSPVCQLFTCKTRVALTFNEQNVGAKSLLGHRPPLQSYFQTVPWQKERSPNGLFPASLCFNTEVAHATGLQRGYVMLYRDMALAGNHSGIRGENVHILSIRKSRNAAITIPAGEVIHKPDTTDTHINSSYRERKGGRESSVSCCWGDNTVLLEAKKPFFHPSWVGRLIPELTSTWEPPLCSLSQQLGMSFYSAWAGRLSLSNLCTSFTACASSVLVNYGLPHFSPSEILSVLPTTVLISVSCSALTGDKWSVSWSTTLTSS